MEKTVNTNSKKEYWDPIEQTCPDAFAIFSNWIDSYKKRVNWNLIFSNYKAGNELKSLIKFHDLPYEMQIGVLMQFFVETAGPDHRFFLPELVKGYDIRSLADISDYFILLQGEINTQRKHYEGGE